MIVLISLVAAMALASGLLLILEPHPVRSGRNMTLASLQQIRRSAEEALFDFAPTSGQTHWTAIMFRVDDLNPASSHIQNPSSSEPVREPDRPAEPYDHGYHFVIENGQGSPDGQITVGSRWVHQVMALPRRGDRHQINPYVIEIGISADGVESHPTEEQLRTLVWLVQRLQDRFKIPANRVFHDAEFQAPPPSSETFPVAWFRQQLLTYVAP